MAESLLFDGSKRPKCFDVTELISAAWIINSECAKHKNV